MLNFCVVDKGYMLKKESWFAMNIKQDPETLKSMHQCIQSLLANPKI
jgi:hypothetical protein